MVGYTPDEQTSSNQKLIAGAISGVVTRFVAQPLDVLKIKSQLQNKTKYKSLTLFGISKSLYFEEGITAFWHGHNLGQLYSIISTSSQFYVYEVSTKYAFKFTSDHNYNKFLAEFLCGIWSGVCVTTFVTPLDVIRVRQILIKEQYRGFYNGAKAVYRSGGLLAFYEGWLTGILMGPQMGITFAMFSYVQPLLLRNFCKFNSDACEHESGAHNTQHLVVATFVAAGVAGLVSKIVTYPLDLARRRLQIATHKPNDQYFTPTSSKQVVQCTKLLRCMVECYRLNGFKGLYQGLNVTIFKAQVTTVFTFTTYELVCYLMTDFGRHTTC